jgi:hypothetical protein
LKCYDAQILFDRRILTAPIFVAASWIEEPGGKMKRSMYLCVSVFALAFIAQFATAQEAIRPYPPRLSPESTDALPTEEQKRWALATCAVLTQLNHERHDLLGGCERTPEAIQSQKELLERWWDVRNRQDLLNTLVWIEEGGHRQEFDEITYGLSQLTALQLVAVKTRMAGDPATSNKISIALKYAGKFSKRSLSAWDYGRYVALCGWGYVTGYLSENEAWSKIMPAARLLQGSFDSWAALGENYVVGREFWSLKQTRGDTTRNCLKELLSDPASPWVMLDWNTDLSPKAPDGVTTSTVPVMRTE